MKKAVMAELCDYSNSTTGGILSMNPLYDQIFNQQYVNHPYLQQP